MGIVGYNAALIAQGMQADVTVFERSVDRMRELDVSLGRTVLLQMSNRHGIEAALPEADLVIGGVLIHGAKAPHLVSREMLGSMKPGLGAGRRRDRPGRMLRDVASHDALRPDLRGRRRRSLLRREHARRGADHLHLGLSPTSRCPTSRRSPTRALPRALADDSALRLGVNVAAGAITCAPVAEAIGLDYTPLEQALPA